MTIRVTWLPVGHITHGYRRVFVIHKDDVLWRVVNVTPMGYEAVFNTQQVAGSDKVKDPSLWWGLSHVVRLIGDPQAFEKDDDGFLQTRPQPMTEQELLPVEAYQNAVLNGLYMLE
jgi:hypothetical protein